MGCVVMVEGMPIIVNVMLSLMSVMSPPPVLCNLSERTVVQLYTLGVIALGVTLVSYMCVVNKHFKLLEFVFNSVYVDLKYNEIYLTFTAGYVCLCGVCSHLVVLGLSVRLCRYPLWVR